MKLPRPGKKTLFATVGLIGLLGMLAGGLFALSKFDLLPAQLRPALAWVGLQKPEPGAEAPPSEDELKKQAMIADNEADSANPELTVGSEMVALVRVMQVSLEQMGQGDRSASARLKMAMATIHRLLIQQRGRAWSGAEQDALFVYLMSGGSPDSVEEALKSATLSARRRALLAVALPYVRGDKKAAAEAIRLVEPEAFPTALKSRLLMIKSQIETDLPYEQRRDMLARAIDASMGTLIEEAATRRIVELSAAGGAGEDFIYWAGRYARRFSQSLYFGDFVSGFVKSVISFEAKKNSLRQPELDIVVQSLPEEMRLPVINTLQLAALRAGYKGLCHHMSEMALQNGSEDEVLKQRTELYESACRVAESQGRPEGLENIKEEFLTGEDKALFQALKLLSLGITTPAKEEPDPGYGPERPSQQRNMVNALGASVAQQLSATDKVLGGIVP